ncbi:MAG: DUF1801 domain-containing protein [Planctomycetes bacterium]|nr:DUF1801 domain-containing protein [Planctomycetota bacterium]
MGSRIDPAVAAFLRELEHPLKAELDAVREWILAAGPDVREGIKWNAPSFRTSDWFATFHLRSKDGVQLVFHTGAKVKASARTGLAIADPTGLMNWLAKDRGLVKLGSGAELLDKREAFQSLVRAWIRAL